jgi:hypothetical protein
MDWDDNTKTSKRMNKLIIYLNLITIFVLYACNSDDSSSNMQEIIKEEKLYVQEASIKDYRNEYYYEKVNDLVRLKKAICFYSNIEMFHTNFIYNSENQLIQTKRSNVRLGYERRTDVIFNALNYEYSIKYEGNTIIVTNNYGATHTYTVNDNGYAISWTFGEVLITYNRNENNNISDANKSYISKGERAEINASYTYDNKKSIDYIRLPFPFLACANNLLTTVTDDNFTSTNTFKYNQQGYPLEIKNQTNYLEDGVEHSYSKTVLLSYIEESKIK